MKQQVLWLLRKKEIEAVKSAIEDAVSRIEESNKKLEVLKGDKEKVNASHKVFFKKREELNEKIMLLEKRV